MAMGATAMTARTAIRVFYKHFRRIQRSWKQLEVFEAEKREFQGAEGGRERKAR